MDPHNADDWHVYIVECRDGSLYTGVAKDVAARVDTHNAGRGAKYTRAKRPVKLVHTESGFDRGSALSREWAIKRMTRAAKLGMVVHGHT